MILCSNCPLVENCETKQDIIEELRASGMKYLDNISLTTIGLNNDNRCPLNKLVKKARIEL